MSAPKDGGPAYPRVALDYGTLGSGAPDWIVREIPGMSLRAWLAGQALAGKAVQDAATWDEVGVYAVKAADATLRALGLTEGEG